jgi:hypothetical protein
MISSKCHHPRLAALLIGRHWNKRSSLTMRMKSTVTAGNEEEVEVEVADG